MNKKGVQLLEAGENLVELLVGVLMFVFVAFFLISFSTSFTPLNLISTDSSILTFMNNSPQIFDAVVAIAYVMSLLVSAVVAYNYPTTIPRLIFSYIAAIFITGFMIILGYSIKTIIESSNFTAVLSAMPVTQVFANYFWAFTLFYIAVTMIALHSNKGT